MTKISKISNKTYIRKDNNTMNIVDCNGIIIEGAHNQDMKDVMRETIWCYAMGELLSHR